MKKRLVCFILMYLVINCFFKKNVDAQNNFGVCCPFIGWNYVIPITLTNNTAQAIPANLQTLIRFNTQTPIGQGKMQANGNDIRITDGTCGNYLPYYIESGINTTATDIWVRTPIIPAGGSITLYMYYGNAAAPAGAVTFNAMFPNVLTVNAPATYNSMLIYDWIDIQAGATITMPNNGTPPVLQARRIIFNGTYNGNNLGFGPQSGPGGGDSGGGSIGGGGGGYGGAGGRGGGNNNGGSVYGTPNGIDIDKGSGGGGSDCAPSAAGGGAISLIGSSVTINGTINVNGQTAQSCCCGNSSEAAGGGSGGGVLIFGDYIAGNATINARGGNGGNSTGSNNKEGGGGGGGGRVKLIWTNTYAFGGIVNINGGNAGTGGQSGMRPGDNGTSTQPQVAGLAIAPGTEVPVSIPTAAFSFNNVCLNTQATFTDASTVESGGAVAQWAWNFGDGNTSANQNPNHTYNTSNTYTVTLTVTSVSGCTATETAQISVSDNPTADFIANNVCEGFASQFTDATTGGTITQWNWNFGDGNTSTNQNPIHTYNLTNIYTVTLQVATAAGCSSTVVKQVAVEGSPQAAFSAPNVCLTNQTIFADASTSTVGVITNWNWDFGNGQSSIQQNPAIIYNTPGTYNVSLTVTSVNGCSNEIINTVEVYALPLSEGSANAVCAGLITNFSDNSNISSGTITQWQWSFGDGNNSNQQNPAHTFSASGSYTAVLTITSDNGCTATSQPISVDVFPNPIVNFSVNSVCLGFPATFTNNSTVNSGSIASNTWSFGDGNFSTDLNPSNIYSNEGNYIIKLVVITDNSCSDSLQTQVGVFENPELDFTATPACFDENNGSATALPINGVSPYSFQWNNGQSSSTAVNLAAGDYDVTITDANGCTVSGMVSVTQPSNPLLISILPDTFSINFGDTVQFSITNNYDNNLIYTISPDYNINCTNCSEPSAYPIRTTTYNITTQDSNGCYGETEVTVNVREKYILYVPNAFTPNGNGTNDRVKVYAQGVKNFYWAIFNRWGEKVFEATDINQEWDGTYKGKQLEPGVFVYRLKLVYITGFMDEAKGSIAIIK